jgi:hypothetical protein
MAKSKVAIMKGQMGWTKSSPKCANCRYFTSDTLQKETEYGTFFDEKNKRCHRGGFATGKNCWCNEHKFV